MYLRVFCSNRFPLPSSLFRAHLPPLLPIPTSRIANALGQHKCCAFVCDPGSRPEVDETLYTPTVSRTPPAAAPLDTQPAPMRCVTSQRCTRFPKGPSKIGPQSFTIEAPCRTRRASPCRWLWAQEFPRCPTHVSFQVSETVSRTHRRIKMSHTRISVSVDTRRC